MTDRGVVARVAGWSIRHRWWAIGSWLAFVAAAVVLGGAVETRQATTADLGAGETGHAEQLINEAGLAGPFTETVLFAPREGWSGWNEATAVAAVQDAADRLGAMPDVAEVGDPVSSRHAEAVLLPVTLTGDRDDGADRVAPVITAMAALEDAYPGLHIDVIGDAAITYGVNEVISTDLAGAGMLSLPVTLAVLLVVFGALVAAGVPLLLGFSAVAAATGLWALASQLIPDVGTVPQLILLIGLAVGVDYTLFYLKRQREERARGHGTVDAVRIAAATSGRAVVISALTSVVALAGLYLAGDAVFRALGTGVILVVAVAMLGSLTVLPALLVTLGRAIDQPRIPVLWRLTMSPTTGGGEPRVWRALLTPALRAPRVTLAITLAGLAALAAPALGMNLKATTAEDAPRTIPVMQAYDRLVAAFPGQGHTHQVVVRAPAGRAQAVHEALAGVAERTGGDPLFAVDTTPEVRLSPDRTTSTMALGVPYEVDDPRAEESLSMLRERLLPEALAAVPEAEHAVTGVVAFNVDYTSQQVQRLPWVIGFVLLLTVGMMALAFRSVVVALVSGALAALSVAAAFGVVTLVFQHWWEGSSGHIVDWVPLFLFVVLLGLSMDYHAFVVSRIREAATAGMETRSAVRAGVIRSAGTVASAALVMVAVFSIFATLSLVEMKQLGVGLAAAIAIDATVVRLLLLPAVMTLLGRVNWWPSGLARRA